VGFVLKVCLFVSPLQFIESLQNVRSKLYFENEVNPSNVIIWFWSDTVVVLVLFWFLHHLFVQMTVIFITNCPRILSQLRESLILTQRMSGVTVISDISSDSISSAGNVSSKNSAGSPFNFVFSANTDNEYFEYGTKSLIVVEVAVTFRVCSADGVVACCLHARYDTC
jgi:hypothetical protein